MPIIVYRNYSHPSSRVPRRLSESDLGAFCFLAKGLREPWFVNTSTTRVLLLFVVVLSGYLLDQDVLAMEPNLIPEPPIENPPDRRDAPPLPLTPIVKSNKRFFRPAPRSFVQADRGSPPLPNPPPNSWPADVRHKFAGDVTAEQYDARKRTEVIRPPTTLKFDVDESPRIARRIAREMQLMRLKAICSRRR